MRRRAYGIKAGAAMNVRHLLAPLLLAACGPAAPDLSTAPLAGARIGGAFALVDQNGHAFTDRNLAGRWRVMYFGYTFCPDVCPTDAAAIGAGLKLVERERPALAQRIVPVFVSVDPARDTPAVLRQFVAAFHPRFVGLTGPAPAIAAIAKHYGVFYGHGETSPGGGYMVNHSRTTYLMDTTGKPIALVPADQGARAVADTIERWVR